MRFIVVLGARPNVVKAAPLIHELEGRGHSVQTIHTGQHYDYNMFGSFLNTFKLRDPEYPLEVSNFDRSTRLAEIIEGVGAILKSEKLNACIVVGDVDSTLGGALGAHLTKTTLIHLEAGLRSGDWTMPEENNRFIVDHLSDLLLTSTTKAADNLLKECARGDVKIVGNTMIDSLTKVYKGEKGPFNMSENYILVTLHREALMDDLVALKEVMEALSEIGKTHKVYLLNHPRSPIKYVNNVDIVAPLSYSACIGAIRNAKLVITDSGGVQEETTYLGVPCLTYRDNTERDITITHGTNILVGMNGENLINTVRSNFRKPSNLIAYWDGSAATRAVDEIERFMGYI